MIIRRRPKKNFRCATESAHLRVGIVLLVVIVALVCGVWVWAYQRPIHHSASQGPQESEPPVTLGSPALSSANLEPQVNLDQQLTHALETIVDQITSSYGGRAGIAIAVPGARASISQAGSLTSDVAWSTVKVPIAMAVVQRTGGINNDVVNAITVSDNAAAETLWASLGNPMLAAQQVHQILRSGRDSDTVINTELTRPGYTVFGQTQWALSNQAVFGAYMQCAPGGRQIAKLMKSISPDQSYGLGRIPGAAFKGGWGPDVQNTYLVRQFGFIPGGSSGQYLGVAVAVRPGDGSYESGQGMLNDVADALSQLSLPAGKCGET